MSTRSGRTSRRTVLLLGSTAALGVLGSRAFARGPSGSTLAPRTDPFTLGVASGDPAPDGFVIWTRLACSPLDEDGRGGMAGVPYEVEWQVAKDDRFADVAATGTAWADPAWAHSVHVELMGLEPGREYFYRFRIGGWYSPMGRTRTAPRATELPAALAFAFMSCAEYEHGWFTGYRRVAESEPELVLHLGDYIYEYAPHYYNATSGNVRDHTSPETRTLADYRRRHAQYKLDPDLQAAHAIAPWLAVPDDHDVANNWAGLVPMRPDPAFPTRRDAALRAYWENMPLRAAAAPVAGVPASTLRLYRRIGWGRLATFHLLDTRQFRDDQACDDSYRICPQASDPARTILGADQERWLLDGLAASSAGWDLLGQQVFFSQRDKNPGPSKSTSMDAWDGYVACRNRIVDGWARVRNAVVLTGDVHSHWVADVKRDFDDPHAPVVGSELVTTSLTTSGDGVDSEPDAHPFFANNPHLRFHNNQRGFVRARLTSAELTADFLTLNRVSQPDAEALLKARFTIADRVPGPRLGYLRPLPTEPTSPLA
ncbi:alkaline phosphatase D family protein [Catellatospora tritici]|uniref:alkaline phosphatase D family protein n=1 Tax=Catellatospora tritici TaxID=2851566 RepID=UPI001C2D44D1|nr:alkaline phosphatase D family protein [Catellatospora tritici]MBV1849739.1 alkaline phosphatase D family protein [Catellatospora tritici]